MPKASEIAKFLAKPLTGQDIVVSGVSSLSNPKPNHLLFINKFSADTPGVLNRNTDVLALAHSEYEGKLTIPHILTSKPRLDFAKVMREFFAIPRSKTVASTASIEASAKIGIEVGIGHFTTIGKNVQIGDGTEIRDHVVIRDNTVIGRNCLVKSHSVIGEEGFGFEFEDDGTPVRLQHYGRVIIGDDVEIGALDVIARGTIDDTVIGNRVKIDDHVFIAHNVTVGDNSIIIAGSEISGSVKIGKNAWIAPQATIINHVTIGENSLVGIGAVVTKSVEPNTVVVGNPAKFLKKRTPA